MSWLSSCYTLLILLFFLCESVASSSSCSTILPTLSKYKIPQKFCPKTPFKLAARTYDTSMYAATIFQVLVNDVFGCTNGVQLQIIADVDTDTLETYFSNDTLHADILMWENEQDSQTAASIAAGNLSSYGPDGETGREGWFIPSWMEAAFPEVEVDLYTSYRASGSQRLMQSLAAGRTLTTAEVNTSRVTQGVFTTGLLEWARNDIIISNLNLFLNVSYLGDEDTYFAIVEKALKAGNVPILFYLGTPSRVYAQYNITRVELPPWNQDCTSSRSLDCDFATIIFWKIGLPESVIESRFGIFMKNLLSDFTMLSGDITQGLSSTQPFRESACEWMATRRLRWIKWSISDDGESSGSSTLPVRDIAAASTTVLGVCCAVAFVFLADALRKYLGVRKQRSNTELARKLLSAIENQTDLRLAVESSSPSSVRSSLEDIATKLAEVMKYLPMMLRVSSVSQSQLMGGTTRTASRRGSTELNASILNSLNNPDRTGSMKSLFDVAPMTQRAILIGIDDSHDYGTKTTLVSDLVTIAQQTGAFALPAVHGPHYLVWLLPHGMDNISPFLISAFKALRSLYSKYNTPVVVPESNEPTRADEPEVLPTIAMTVGDVTARIAGTDKLRWMMVQGPALGRLDVLLQIAHTQFSDRAFVTDDSFMVFPGSGPLEEVDVLLQYAGVVQELGLEGDIELKLFVWGGVKPDHIDEWNTIYLEEGDKADVALQKIAVKTTTLTFGTDVSTSAMTTKEDVFDEMILKGMRLRRGVTYRPMRVL
eukprot:PhF_6_TR13373/c0_g1_i1/m.21221